MNKKFYLSKTIWSGVAIVVLGVLKLFEVDPVVMNTLITVASGLGLIGIRDAMDK